MGQDLSRQCNSIAGAAPAPAEKVGDGDERPGSPRRPLRAASGASDVQQDSGRAGSGMDVMDEKHADEDDAKNEDDEKTAVTAGRVPADSSDLDGVDLDGPGGGEDDPKPRSSGSIVITPGWEYETPGREEAGEGGQQGVTPGWEYVTPGGGDEDGAPGGSGGAGAGGENSPAASGAIVPDAPGAADLYNVGEWESDSEEEKEE